MYIIMSKWTIVAAFIAGMQVFHLVTGGAIFEMRVVSYSNPEGTDWNDAECDSGFLMGSRWKCDLKFTFCFDKPTGSWEPDVCDYKNVVSSEYPNTHYVTFGSKLGDFDNPIKMPFHSWPGAIRFKVKILDDDSFNNDDLVDIMHTLWPINPERSSSQSGWTTRVIAGTRQHDPTSLVVNLRLYCEPNYYNTRCDEYCVASSGPTRYYTCDAVTGAQNCWPGWEGSNCDIISDDCIANECTHGATCEDGNRQYTCNCIAGFEGRFCETNIDDCATAPCLNGGSCIDRVNGYSCVCPLQYVGPTCARHICDEDTSPCLSGGTCHVDDNTARCLCAPDFSGEICETDRCVGVTCLNEGNCKEGICICQPGWEGTNCDVIFDDCLENECTNGAICEDGNRQYTCNCAVGFTGRYCKTNIDDCLSAPCANGGQCVDEVDGYHCACEPEYVGVTCSHHVCDEDTSPCLNRGTCHVQDSEPRCRCTDAFSGPVCETDKCLNVTCENLGACDNGVCFCQQDWEGENCDIVSDDCLTNNCTNGGTCQDGHRQYTCNCTVGFTGRYCETNINDCLPAFCANGGQCVDDVDGYHCVCQPEYVGVTCSHHVCDEDTSPCLNGGSCHVQDREPRCRCPDAFSGRVCETDTCLNVTCENSGTCENGICICQQGWEGPNCDVISDDCISNKCANGATCVDGQSQYTCICVIGFTGPYCETNIDDCIPDPCLNGGSCSDRIDAYECVCAPEYVGVICSSHVCDSDRSPCLNGGTCYVQGNLARCLCPPAFSGDACELDKCLDVTCLNEGTCENGICLCRSVWEGITCDVISDDCLTHKCVNGATCRDGDRQYTCICSVGFEGQHCETNIDDCTPEPCYNGGRCVDRVDGYTCVCQAQYVGVNCSHHVCDEDTSPCLNGGTCFVVDNEARCDCLPAFAGDLCEREKCLNITCLNEGACVNGICICQHGWEGTYCDVIADDCIDNACANGATCRDGRRLYTCECLVGFTGRYCETDVDDCVAATCYNGGTCFDEVGTYKCECQSEYVGPRCSRHVCDSDHSNCQNGGVCYVSGGEPQCLCPAAFSGDVCERDKCLDVTCLNQGSCEKGACVCGPGYVGVACSYHVCDADKSPCLNGGSCYVQGDEAKCRCTPAFAGDHCERDKCFDMICLNQGSCENGTCVCRPGYTGVFCGLDLCQLTTCLNGASCQDGACRCAPGFSGRHCHVDMNECESDPCQHGGTCRDHVNGYTCDCLPEYNGTYCEHVIPTSYRHGESQDLALDRVTPIMGDVTTPETAALQSKSLIVPLWTIGVVVGLLILFLIVAALLLLTRRRRAKRKASADSVVRSAECQRGVDANGGVTAVSNPQYDVIPALSWHRCVMNQLHGGHNGVMPPPYSATIGRLSVGVQGIPVCGTEAVGHTGPTNVTFDNPTFETTPTYVSKVTVGTEASNEISELTLKMDVGQPMSEA